MGDHHICMFTELGLIKCWGNLLEGVLGYGYVIQIGGWLGNVLFGDTVSFFVVGVEHICAIVDDGKVCCWGEVMFIGYDGIKNIGDDEKFSKFLVLWFGEVIV